MAEKAVEKAVEKPVKTTNKKPVNNAKPKEKKDGMLKRTVRYFKDVKSEWKKVTWPTKSQIKNNTAVVLVVMAMAAVIIWPLDWVLIKIFGLMFH